VKKLNLTQQKQTAQEQNSLAKTEKQKMLRESNRSAGMISGDISTKIKYTLQFFSKAVSKLNEKACGDRSHPTPITRSIGELANTYPDYQPRYQLILVYRKIFCTDAL